MNNIEFKALVKGLFLSQEQVRVIGGYKDQRQIRRFFSGEAKPHADLVIELKKIDSEIDRVVIYSVNQAIESGVDQVSVIGYKNQDQFIEWSDGSLPYIELHLCLLFRLCKAIQRHGISFNVVPFDEDAYIDFINDRKLDDNQASMSVWATSFQML